MLEREELASWAAVFGVADEQIRRDHLVSHVLAGLATLDGDGLVFYGGTALARTHLPHFRLSEDVDLLVAPRREWAERIERHLPSVLRRGFGPVQWRPAPSEVPSGAASMLVAGDRAVRLQLVSLDREERRWPVERRQLEMRYADVPLTVLTVPTLAAFAAMKTLAWEERGAARDLADLAALAELGALDVEAAGLVRDIGGWRPHSALFDRLPAVTRNAWCVDLSHQMAAPPDPEACLRTVREAWATALGWS